MRIELTEHRIVSLVDLGEDASAHHLQAFEDYRKIVPRTFTNKRNQEIAYYDMLVDERSISVQAGYYIGLDWLIPREKALYIAPKINRMRIERFEASISSTEEDMNVDSDVLLHRDQDLLQLNFLKMFLDAACHPDVSAHTDGLLFIDWDSPEIEIEQHQDQLSPFLIIQFLHLLRDMVRKGLKKSYYSIESNLSGKVKGKILLNRHIKHNIVTNKAYDTYCSYQEFGVDNPENRFLKRVLQFVKHYIISHSGIFSGNESSLSQLMAFISPAFAQVRNIDDDYSLKHFRFGPVFKEYKSAIRIGEYILKRFGYNFSRTSAEKIYTPPYWIDMPRLFELYVYKQLLDAFPGNVRYHYTARGNELDFLITLPESEMVIDAKYKLQYQYGKVHEDIRQVSGYARLDKVYRELGIWDDRLVDCVIIYPNPKLQDIEVLTADQLTISENKFSGYRRVFKVPLNIPLLTIT